MASCGDQIKDLSGNYEDISSGGVTKIKRISDTTYELIDPHNLFKVPVTRKANTLYGAFQGKNISCEFNSTYDTITAKTNNVVSFVAKKVYK